VRLYSSIVMPTQSRGFWTCDYCRQPCDTIEEAREHEAAQCPHRPHSTTNLPRQQQQQQPPGTPASAATASHPQPPLPGYPPDSSPHPPTVPPPQHSSAGSMGPLSSAVAAEMENYQGQGNSSSGGGEMMMHHKNGGLRSIPLLGPRDMANLTVEDCIACQNIEIFEATPQHAADNNGAGGGTPVLVGQLGLRCMHCASSPLSAAAYSTVFPTSLGSIAGNVRMVADQHLSICGMAPPEIQELCERAANKRQQGNNNNNNEQEEEEERNHEMALVEYCIGLSHQLGITNKQPQKSGIVWADPAVVSRHHPVETPGPRHGRAQPQHPHSMERGMGGLPPHSADRGGLGGPPMSVDRMGYPTPGGGPPGGYPTPGGPPPGAMMRPGPPQHMMGGPMGPGGDHIAPTPLQRRRDRHVGEPPVDAGHPPHGYPTPYSQGPPEGYPPEGAGGQTPAQPNFEGGQEGGQYPTPYVPETSSPVYTQHLTNPNPQYDLPSNFPFYQENDRTWNCKFCSHLHPQYRDPQSLWSVPTGGPPPGNFIDHHLTMCRSYHQSMPSPPMYQGPPPPSYGVPYGHMSHGMPPYGAVPPPGWEGHSPPHAGGAPMHPQHLQYGGSSGAGEPQYAYPGEPPHYEQHAPAPRYAEQAGYGAARPSQGPPGAVGAPRQPAQQGASHGGSPSGMDPSSSLAGPRSKENIADAVRHAINYLVATDKEYYSLESRGTSTTVLNLVLEEDRLLLTDYFFFLMKQLRLCRFSESDRKTRGGKREKIKIGYGGLQCVHCADVPNSRKFFWSNVDRLANSFAEIPGHVLKCRRCSQQTKDALMQLKQFHPEQMARLPRGSQKVFFRRMWRRLHDEDPQPEDAPDVDAAPSIEVEDEDESNLDGLKPAATPRNPSPDVKQEKDDSPGSKKSDESTVILQRTTQEAAKALAASTKYSEPPSPSSKVLLAIPDDKEWLSDMDCYIRKQLEVFCATEDDVTAAQSDRKYPVHIGQVGIRCIHCSLCKTGAGAHGTAVAFPFSISGIYESVREFQRLHLDSCENLPGSTKAKLNGFKGSSSLSSVLRKYYVLAAKALGLQDTRNGIRSGAESIPLGSQAAFTFAEGGTPQMTTEMRQQMQPQYEEEDAAKTPADDDKKRKQATSNSQSPNSAEPPPKSGRTEEV
jgi:hypothetical protein